MPGSAGNKGVITRSEIQGIIQVYQNALDSIIIDRSKRTIKGFDRELKMGHSNPSIFVSGDLLESVRMNSSLARLRDNERAVNIERVGNITVILNALLRKKSITPLALAFSMVSLSYDSFHSHSQIRSDEARASFGSMFKHAWKGNSDSDFVIALTPYVAQLKDDLIPRHLEILDEIHKTDYHADDPAQHQFKVDELKGFYQKLKASLSTAAQLKSGLGIFNKASNMLGVAATQTKNDLCLAAREKIKYYWKNFFVNNLISREDFLAAVAATLMETYYECVQKNTFSKQANHERLILPYIEKANAMMLKALDRPYAMLKQEIGERQDLSYLLAEEDDDLISPDEDPTAIYQEVQAHMPETLGEVATDKLEALSALDAVVAAEDAVQAETNPAGNPEMVAPAVPQAPVAPAQSTEALVAPQAPVAPAQPAEAPVAPQAPVASVQPAEVPAAPQQPAAPAPVAPQPPVAATEQPLIDFQQSPAQAYSPHAMFATQEHAAPAAPAAPPAAPAAPPAPQHP